MLNQISKSIESICFLSLPKYTSDHFVAWGRFALETHAKVPYMKMCIHGNASSIFKYFFSPQPKWQLLFGGLPQAFSTYWGEIELTTNTYYDYVFSNL